MSPHDLAHFAARPRTGCMITLAALLFAVGHANAAGPEAMTIPQQLTPTDVKTIAGNACHGMSTGGTLLKWFSYALDNNWTGAQSVVCPIVRDNAYNTNGTFNVLVNIYNPAAGQDFECMLNSYAKFGTLLASDTASTSTEGSQTLTLDVNASESLGYYTLVCTLPPSGPYNSKIYSYTYREHPATDNEQPISSQTLP
jgi:hypothetical protein